MITIPVTTLKAARKLLTKIRFERFTLPVLTHVLATIDAAGLSLVVTDLDHWLEVRIPATLQPHEPGSFLIPAEALKAAASGDKGSSARFEFGGDPKTPALKLTVACGGMPVETTWQPETVDQFPSRPVVEGTIHQIPKETFQALVKIAGFASTDSTRHVLNGVLFTPEDGGMLVATDGKRLGVAPARVTDREFILANVAVKVLGHPDFLLRDAAMIQPADTENFLVQFRSGPLTLIAKTIEGSYPGYKRVIPANLFEIVVIQENLKSAMISWLRSLRGRSESVVLTWETPGQMTMAQTESDLTGATLQVPVTIEGNPPVICFNPKHLADAFEIGSTLKLSDEMTPGIVTDPFGNFCLLMSKRITTAIPSNILAGTAMAA